MPQKITFRPTTLRRTLLGLAALGLSASAAQAQTVYGLSITSNAAASSLVTFNAATPGTFTLSGYAAGQAIVGIDSRPNTGQLFALGYNPTGTVVQLYTINPTSGVLTAVGAALTQNLGTTTSRIGFDFNPTVDRIRVTSGNRANFRLNPVDGTVTSTDTQLAYAATDANAAATPNIGASAYTNSVANATAATTALYNYDLGLNILATQSAPNTGVLTTVGPTNLVANTATPSLDLDIYSSAAGTNTAYLVANPGTATNTNLYTVNLATGATTLVGAIGNGLAARDIAVAGTSGVVTAVRERTDLATGFGLYPNPGRQSTTVAFELLRPARVEFSVFDHAGRRVATQSIGLLPAGPQAVRWEAANNRPGLYLVRLSIDGQPAASRQLVLE